MLIVMKQGATAEQIQRVCDRIREIGYTPHEIPGSIRTAVGITGNPGAVSPDHFQDLDGVAECVPISKPYKLVSREVKPEPTIIDVRGAKVGDGGLHIMAGPCSVESRDQILRTAEAVAASGAKFLRGGAYKPRTSPYAFQGMKEEGLRLLADVKAAFDLRIVTEVKDVESLAAVAEVADVVQIGARNMQNFSLLEAAGRLRRPVLLKRGISATLQELFMAAEYLLSLGNYNVMLCERGIRTYETMTRNTFDLSAVVMIKHHTHLPVIADPSHGVGISWAVPPLARASVVAGADGVMIETHPDPSRALSDGQQSLTLPDYAKLMDEMKALAAWRAQ
ncbi:MAG: 3-deoxy-7-phosphoheptulonate synthase [Phycisphaerae bacterium]|nr:MAG: 3-deoxy-7-phosphoheptulonate synthase [Planctomycetia bacterium]RIK71704.1 MAG: 3-deoxy-7-phosphoheptulonate synthase [Planctomycetota bacterium]GJQ25395.1 MAG: 3-deoxy-7-phosphoheptulonate synthase [Phycisphaerae bacterium]